MFTERVLSEVRSEESYIINVNAGPEMINIQCLGFRVPGLRTITIHKALSCNRCRWTPRNVCNQVEA